MTSDVGAVTVRLKGGLGNQLFQYATARALSIERDAPLHLDAGWYAHRERERRYRLREFRIAGQDVAVSKARHRALGAWSRVSEALGAGSTAYRHEPPDNGYRPIEVRPGKAILLDGYWQSERYFRAHRETLLEELSQTAERMSAQRAERSTEPPSGSSFEPMVAAPVERAVAVHVRRGDYLAGPATHVVSEAYVRRAMTSFGSNADFLMFSDDPAWCRERFRGDNVAFAENGSDVQDLVRMSRAAHNIIANSSFSWWAAWLNRDPDRRVIAPRPWTPYGSHADIVAEGWESLPIDGA